MSERSKQPRKKKVVKYQITVECHTQFMENYIDSVIRLTIDAMSMYLKKRHTATKIDIEKQ